MGRHFVPLASAHSGGEARDIAQRRGHGIKRPKAAALLLAASGLVVLAAAPGRIGAQDVPPVAFAETVAITLSAEPGRAQLLNNTGSAWQLVVTAYLDVVDGVGETRNLQLEDAPTAIAPGGSVLVPVPPAPDGVTKASGFLVVIASNESEPATVARRPLVVGAAAATPKPRLEKWSGSSQADFFSSMSGQPMLPLEGPSCGSLGTIVWKVGVASGSDVATISYECTPGSPAGDLGLEFTDATLKFNVDQIAKVGQYAGTTKIGETTVALSYLKSESAEKALFAISIGLLVAVLRQANTATVRPVRRVNKRLTQVGMDALERQREFERRAGAAPYKVYDLMSAVAPEVARLQVALADIQPGWWSWRGIWMAFGGYDKERLDALVGEAAELDGTVQAWPRFADELAKLTQALPSDKAVVDRAPFLVQGANSILAPSGEGSETKRLTIAEARELLTNVSKLTSAFELLPIVDQVLRDLPKNPPAEPADREAWAEGRRLARQVRAEFLVAKDVSSLEKAKVDELLARARALSRQVAPERKIGNALAAAPRARITVESSIPMFDDVGKVIGAAWAVLRPRSLALLWLFISILVALWTGLQLYYIDKPWGRPADYVIIGVWALGAATILTNLLAALEDVVERPLTLKKPEKGSDA